MPDILFHYERVNPTSWAYLSSLLMLAMYFKFNRIWSVRNLDLFLLIFLAPGLLLVQWAAENMEVHANAPSIQYMGFLWLFVTEGLLLVRLLFDSAMVRRPLLEPNLNAAGLLCLGGSLLFFLMANVVTGIPSAADLSPARQAEVVRVEEAEENQDTDVQSDSFSTDGPGFWLLYRQPRILTQQLIGAGDPEDQETPAKPRPRRAAHPRSHGAGRRHFVAHHDRSRLAGDWILAFRESHRWHRSDDNVFDVALHRALDRQPATCAACFATDLGGRVFTAGPFWRG